MNTVIDAVLTAAKETHKLPMLRIIETGCEYTSDIVEWISKQKDFYKVTFDTTDLDFKKQESIHQELEKSGTSKFYTLHTQDHKKFLSDLSWVDIAFLHPDNLDEGLDEFRLTASAGAKAIVLNDYQTRGAKAVKQAQRFGWIVEDASPYYLLVRPEDILMKLTQGK